MNLLSKIHFITRKHSYRLFEITEGNIRPQNKPFLICDFECHCGDRKTIIVNKSLKKTLKEIRAHQELVNNPEKFRISDEELIEIRRYIAENAKENPDKSSFVDENGDLLIYLKNADVDIDTLHDQIVNQYKELFDIRLKDDFDSIEYIGSIPDKSLREAFYEIEHKDDDNVSNRITKLLYNVWKIYESNITIEDVENAIIYEIASRFYNESRSNGCICCNGDEALMYKDDMNNAFVDGEGNMLVCVMGKDVEFKVKHCPNCGREF